MDYEWMGRYRALVAALTRHVNVLEKLKDGFRAELPDGAYIDRPAWQILEYFIEHGDNTHNMLEIATKLGIPQSTFSKKVNMLKRYGFIERFFAEGNRKEIIVRPTEKAFAFYKQNTDGYVSKIFEPFFEKLERFSDEEIASLTEAFDAFTDACETKEQKPHTLKYIKMD